MSVTGRALLRGGTFRLVTLGTGLVLQLAMVPYVLRHLGDHLYGLWAVIGAATGYYGLLDLGVSSAVSLFVARELGRGNPAQAGAYVAAGRKFFWRSAWGIAGLTVAVAFFGRYLIETPEDRAVFFQTVLIIGLGIALAFPAKLHSGLLVANLRHDLIASIGFGSSLLRAGLVFVVLHFGGSILALATVNAVISVAVAGVTLLAARRYCQPLPAVHKVASATTRELSTYASFSLLAQIGDFVRTKIHPLTISAYLRVADVTPYAIHDRLQSVVVDACGACLSMLTPVFGRQEGRGDREAVRRTYLLAYKISCYVGSFLLGILLIIAPAFLQVWLGRSQPVVVQLLYLRAAGSLCGIIQMPSVNLLFGAEGNRSYAMMNAAHALVTLVSTVLLIQHWGLPGVVVGVSLTTLLIKTFVQAGMAGRIIGVGLAEMHGRHTLPHLLRVVPFLAVAWLSAILWLQPKWWHLCLFLGLAGPAFAGYIFRLGFNAEERALFLRSMKFWQ